MRFRTADLRPHGWSPPQTLQIPDWCGCSTECLPVPWATAGGRSCRSGSRRRRPAHCAAGSLPCLTGQPTPARSHERPTPLTSMPHERLPDLPRVVVARIEGRDTLYEFDLTAAPTPAWRAAFLRPPPALITLTTRPTLAASRFTGARCISAPRLGTGATGCAGSTSGLPTPTRWWTSDQLHGFRSRGVAARSLFYSGQRDGTSATATFRCGVPRFPCPALGGLRAR